MKSKLLPVLRSSSVLRSLWCSRISVVGILLFLISSNIFAAENKQQCIISFDHVIVNALPMSEDYSCPLSLQFSRINGQLLKRERVICARVKFTKGYLDSHCPYVPLWAFQYNDDSFKNDETITLAMHDGTVMKYQMDESFAFLPDLYEKYMQNKSSGCITQ